MMKSRLPRGAASALPLAAALLCGALTFWILFTDFLAPFYVQGPPPGASEAAFRRALDREIPLILHRYRVPGMVIGTIVHGDPGQLYPYGVADTARGAPMTGRTVFQVASLAKSVTAWGVMTLVDAGKIDLDQPAERYLSAWPLAQSAFPSGAVTVRQLLTHTAGVNGGDDRFRGPGERAASPAELLAGMGPRDGGRPTRATLVAPAGKTFLYSPAGYTVLQMIIERQSGRPFQAYMRDAVLRPLGMMSSSYGWDPELRAATATPYLADGRARPILLPQDVAADGLFTTAADLTRFVAAPVDGRILPVGAGVISDRTARCRATIRMRVARQSR
jgi:CubicO group peptidase (beta-lactamase class C family)